MQRTNGAQAISTRTPHAGSDKFDGKFIIDRLLFQPALPMRGVTLMYGINYVMFQFQPALPMRGVTQKSEHHGARVLISTRTPHAGSDTRIFEPS